MRCGEGAGGPWPLPTQVRGNQGQRHRVLRNQRKRRAPRCAYQPLKRQSAAGPGGTFSGNAAADVGSGGPRQGWARLDQSWGWHDPQARARCDRLALGWRYRQQSQQPLPGMSPSESFELTSTLLELACERRFRLVLGRLLLIDEAVRTSYRVKRFHTPFPATQRRNGVQAPLRQWWLRLETAQAFTSGADCRTKAWA